MEIRKAGVKDLDRLYKFGLNTPELKVNPKEKFMSKGEFLASIKNKNGVFLLAENKGEVCGFIYSDTEDVDREERSVACLVYIAVSKNVRGKHIGSKLYSNCIKELKKRKVKYVYAWANPKSGVVEFFKKKGFEKGNYEIWMDKKI